MFYVIGSGPAGIACAQALVRAGRDVTILDPGMELEEDRRRSIAQLQGADSANWTRQSTAFLREGISSGKAGIPLKLAYGSDFPYRESRGATVIRCDGVESKPSYARGGLSAVWGAAMLPYRQADIEDWPITVKDLEPGYRAVLEWMPLAGRADDLSEMFPLYSDCPAQLPMSRQASGMLADVERNREKLKAKGLRWGCSRLAVDANGAAASSPCVECGLCMYGCPHGLIYSSDLTLAALLSTKRVQYRSGLTVQKIEENAGEVEIHAINSDGRPEVLRGERAFVGAGVLNTTAILLRSLGLYDHPVAMRDSQYFLMPLLRLRGTRNVVREPLYTLAQLFVEIFDQAISPYTVHLQTYTYNDLFRQPLEAALGPLKAVFPIETFLGRLMLFQGYLHSKQSTTIKATLVRTSEGDALQLHAEPNAETKKQVRKIAGKLTGLAFLSGVLPLAPLIQIGQPGRGFHTGGSFCMSRQPKLGETDILGRPYGLERVHAIDASVLPTIPATTITYTVMANAYRIGTQSAALD